MGLGDEMMVFSFNDSVSWHGVALALQVQRCGGFGHTSPLSERPLTKHNIAVSTNRRTRIPTASNSIIHSRNHNHESDQHSHAHIQQCELLVECHVYTYTCKHMYIHSIFSALYFALYSLCSILCVRYSNLSTR